MNQAGVSYRESERCAREERREKGTGDLAFLYTAAELGIIDLEEAADAILASQGCLGAGSGIYSQRQLDRKMRRENDRLPQIAEAEVPQGFLAYLVEKQMDELIDVSGLSAMQEIVFRMCAAGMSCWSASQSLGIGHHLAARHLKHAQIKMQNSYREGKYAGWYEVYLSEINRTRVRERR